jgi:formyl-CoA transferase
MGQPALAQDQRFRDHVQRGKHQKELDAIVEGWTRQHSVADVEQMLIEAAVPAGRMYRAQEMLADPHFEARESIVDVQHPRWGILKMQNVFPRLSASPGRVRTIAPQQVGEHNRAIYGGRFGLSDSELDDLAARGVI